MNVWIVQPMTGCEIEVIADRWATNGATVLNFYRKDELVAQFINYQSFRVKS